MFSFPYINNNYISKNAQGHFNFKRLWSIIQLIALITQPTYCNIVKYFNQYKNATSTHFTYSLVPFYDSLTK